MVPSLSITIMGINIVIAILIPMALTIYFAKFHHGSLKPWAIGIAVMYVFALNLEQIAHSAILSSPAGEVIQNNIWLYALYGGFMAGLFEEVGRFIAYKYLLKNSLDNPYNSVMYGIGHGGFEMVYFLGVGMFGNIVYANIINAGQMEEVLATVEDQATIDSLRAVIDELINTSPATYLISPVERIAALAAQIGLSIIVYYSVKREDKVWLFPVAFACHFLLDAVSVLVNSVAPIYVTEICIYILSAGILLLAIFIWKKWPIEYTYVPKEKREATKPSPTPVLGRSMSDIISSVKPEEDDADADLTDEDINDDEDVEEEHVDEE